VENVGEETIYGCEARLVEVHHIDKPNEFAPTRLIWVGDTDSVDLVKGAPGYVGLMNLLDTGEKQVPSAQGWSFTRQTMFDEPGEYLFRVIVNGRNASPKGYAVKLTLTGDWQTATMQPA
jgi:hypothetical protein